MSTESFAKSASVGPGVRLPRLPALHPKKGGVQNKAIRLGRAFWVRVAQAAQYYASVAELGEKAPEVLKDNADGLTEHEVRCCYPNLVVAPLGEEKK